jgi:uncharacterized protein YjcR
VTSKHRTAIAAYVAADRHLLVGGRGAKTVKQMAKEVGTDPNTVRRWLRREHWELWMEHWPSVEDLWAELQREREEEWERLAEQNRRSSNGRPPQKQWALSLIGGEGESAHNARCELGERTRVTEGWGTSETH